MVRTLLFSCVVCLLAAAPAAAQQPAAPPPSPAALLTTLLNAKGYRTEIEGDHIRIVDAVEIPMPSGDTFFADQVDIYTDTSRLIATGNVVVANAEGRISANRVEFDLATGTGTFHQAWGIMTLSAAANPVQLGAADADVYFHGDVIEKLGPRRYKITRGGFTTCVQPTPRWEVVSGSVTITLDDYAMATNTVLRVKGVPVMYLPVIYYPMHDEERSTGFLMPTYGTSTLRGQALSNAFFWAIDRSQDATFFHDWFTRAGQGAGGEYRYVSSASSGGNIRLYRWAQNRAEYTTNGVVTVLPADTSYEVMGSATQSLGPAIRLRGRVDHSSNIVTQQLLHQNVYRASNPIRVVEGGASGVWGTLSANALYQRTEVFSSQTQSTVYGSTPRLNASVAPQRLFGSPVYGSLTSEYAHLPYQSLTSGATVSDLSVSRMDVVPNIRVPLSRLTFLTVNSTAAYRTTYYSKSLNAQGVTIPEPYTRRYASVRSDVIGPVFTKIWDTPESLLSERMKHVIEPAFSVDYTSGLPQVRRVPFTADATEYVVGGATRFTYGLNNRLFYRGRTVNGVRGVTQEFVTVGVQQTYYTKPEASRYDFQYYGNPSRTVPTDLSPVAVTVRVAPRPTVNASARLEYDVTGIGLQAISSALAMSTVSGSSASVGYTRVRYNRGPWASDYLSGSATASLLQRRLNASYSLNWDILRSYVVNQTIAASYMAQCCGIQVDFQNFNYPTAVGIPIPSDRRFNFGFVLAGLGTFSNFFGAFGGQR